MALPLPTEDLNLILAKTRPLWREMRGKKIFITGGTGFFGCWLVESFVHANRVLELGACATILTRDPVAFASKCPHLAFDPAIDLLAGDVLDFTWPDGDFEFAIHAVTETAARRTAGNALQLLTTMVSGTERVLEFAASHRTRKLLLTSSGAVYGKQPADVNHIPEDFAGAPNPLDSASAYAEGKRAAELVCAVLGAKSGIECKIARCFAFVGPHLPLDAHFAIGNFIRDALAGKAIEIGGDGTAMRSYMYAADLAIWLWTILFRAPALEAFNVGSEEALSILELAHAVAEALGSSAEVRVAQQAIPGAEPQRYVPCVRKAEQSLGLKCEVTLHDAIRRTAAWHKLCLAETPPADK
jgi:dTDP-glucose 4,6-dehydratase